MKKAILTIFFIIFISGCGNFNPRFQNRIDNQNGKLEDLRSNQNGIMAEIGKLRNESQIQNSQLKEVQQGLINMNNSLSKNENSGIQILQGDGSLMLIFALCTMIFFVLFYRKKANESEKIANILAQEVARINDPEINENILRTSMYTPFEKQMFHLLTNNIKKIANKKPK